MLTREQIKRKRRLQRIIGILVLAASALLIIVASFGDTTEDRDCTAAFLTVPIGVALTISKSVLI